MATSLNYDNTSDESNSKYKFKAIAPLQVFCVQKATRQIVPCVHYKFDNHLFKTVKVIGKIIETKFIKNDDLCLTVDDGTGEIRCITKKYDIDKIKEKKQLAENKLAKLLSMKTRDEVLETERNVLFNNASIILLKKLIAQLTERGLNNQYELNSYISVTGNVTEMFENKVLYVNTVRKIPPHQMPAEVTRHRLACEAYLAQK